MEHEVSFDHHRFDPRTGRLWAGRREISLTPRAAAVLGALVARAGQLVTREELFQSVWGDTVVSDAALSACIQELRGALADDARRPRFIETRHRRGYRFAARVQPSAPPAAPAPPGPDPLVVGRDRELIDLRAALAKAAAGTRQIVFVTGEPGIGKTTLIELFLAEVATGERPRIAQGRCIETHGAAEAYLPLLEAMTRLCREPGGQAVTRLLRQHAPTWLSQMPSVLSATERRALPRQSSGVTRERMLRELAEAVEAIASDSPLILWLEDLHWSDPPTVDWLSYVARRPGPARLLVLASCRPFEALAPEHPLEATRNELTMRGHCREIALARLDEPTVSEYLTRRFPPDQAFGPLPAMIHARTGGNPLFVVSVADDLVRRAVLVEHAGRWEVDRGVGQLAIPEDIRRMIGHQLDRVSPDERRLLEAASVAGVEFSAATVAAAGELGVEDAERACAALAARGSFLAVVASEGWPDGLSAGRYGFRHALHQEIVYERTPATRRVHLHRRIAEWLEAALGDRALEAATELAMHFERGQEPRRAIRYLQAAGEIATQRGAAREAVAQLTRALELLRSEPETPARAEREVALQIALGGPLMAVKGRGAPEVEQAYTRAQELCQRIGDTPQIFPAVWGLFLFRRSRGEIDTAHEHATRLLALARRGADPGLLIEAHHALWATRFARGELGAVVDHVTEALGLYDPDRHASLAGVYGNHDPGVCALGHGAWALELAGESERASRHSAEAAALARRLGQPFSEAHALLYAARLHQFRGDWQATRDRAEAAAALAREHGFAQLQAWAAVSGGWALAEAGEIAEGLARAREGVETLRALGSQDFRTYFLSLLAATLAKAGETEAALGVVAEALAAVERSGERFYAAELQRQKGELLVASGRARDAAVGCFESAAEIARRQGAGALARRALRALEKVRS